MTRTFLLQTDAQRSTLGGVDFPSRAYGAYGAYGAQANAAGPMTAFAGQMRDSATGWYHLGNGHRVFNPVLMRFHTADRLSPFGKGGLNAYAYCQNDPVNFHDPSGRFPSWLGPIRSIIGGFVNLAISAVKAYRGYVTRIDFNLDAGLPGSRGGHLTFALAENPVSRWTTQDTALTAFGGFSATVSIGTGIGRLAAADSNALMWVDTAFSMVATALSGYELYTIATAPVIRRYPVELTSGVFPGDRHSPAPVSSWRQTPV